MSVPVLIANAVDVISKNGVVMMNVALRGDGTLPDDQAAILRAFGQWIGINGEGLYGTRPWKVFGEGPMKIVTKRTGENLEPYSPQDIRFTTKDDDLYAFVLAPPTEDIFIKTLGTGGPLSGEIKTITLLGSNETLHWMRSPEGLTIRKPETLPGKYVVAFRITLE
jgi:alpha-L-fucosidase